MWQLHDRRRIISCGHRARKVPGTQKRVTVVVTATSFKRSRALIPADHTTQQELLLGGSLIPAHHATQQELLLGGRLLCRLPTTDHMLIYAY